MANNEDMNGIVAGEPRAPDVGVPMDQEFDPDLEIAHHQVVSVILANGDVVQLPRQMHLLVQGNDAVLVNEIDPNPFDEPPHIDQVNLGGGPVNPLPVQVDEGVADEEPMDADPIFDVYSPVYQRHADMVPGLQELQNERMRVEYNDANRDGVRMRSQRNLRLRFDRMNYFLDTRQEYKRMTSFPKVVFRKVLAFVVDEHGTTMSQMIMNRLAAINEIAYPPAWALFETAHYMAAGTTYKQVANTFGNGAFRQSRIIKVVLGALAHNLTVPTVS